MTEVTCHTGVCFDTWPLRTMVFGHLRITLEKWEDQEGAVPGDPTFILTLPRGRVGFAQRGNQRGLFGLPGPLPSMGW